MNASTTRAVTYSGKNVALDKFIAGVAAPAASTHYKYLRAAARVNSVEDTHILVDDDDTSGGAKWPESIPAGHTPSAPLPIVSPPGGQSDAVHPEAY